MNTRAFSIVELIIVLAVIGILAAILIPVMSNVIKSANEKSALSDAKNTLTSFEAYYQGESQSATDSIFIVNKASKYYVYGYFEKERLMLSSRINPIKAEDIASLISSLSANGGIVAIGEKQEEITSLIETPNSTQVFSGYRLMSLEGELNLNRDVLAIPLGASENLVATITPWEYANVIPIQWKSDNPNIAQVENGTVTGISGGNTTVTASYGDITATCSVIVEDYIEFYGDIAALKVLIEDESDPILFVKIMQNVEAIDVSFLFPIVVPEGKIVRLNVENKYVLYQYFAPEHHIYAMFINNGGDLYIEGDYNKDGLSNYGNVDANAGGENCLIENRNGGKVTFLGGHITQSVYSSGTKKYGIINKDGTVEFADAETYLSSYSRSDFGATATAIYNGEKGTLIIRGGEISGGDASIVNYGEIVEISGGSIGLITNHGLIKEISGGTLYASEKGYAIENIGKAAEIQIISGGIFGVKYDEFGYTQENLILLSENSKIGKITGGTFLGVTAIEYENISDVRGIVHGGYFLQEVPAELIATGKSCKFNEKLGLFEVS
ncbi:MAG: prepilin-type N-terminal cleavage/methylation domain-containing protein [Clostridiales bacterium]|jgi:type IV pilus assembly protein PilA|nr:prepilin-type N-terminal cleavage/methylation domain-containing protein [Clostridiales bacterium]